VAGPCSHAGVGYLAGQHRPGRTGSRSTRYEVLTDFGYDETDLIWERDADDFQQHSLVEQPFEEGNWSDAIVRGYLYDVAEDAKLQALETSTFAPIRDRVGKVLGEEDYHLEFAENWLKRLAANDESRERIQAAVDRLYPTR